MEVFEREDDRERKILGKRITLVCHDIMLYKYTKMNTGYAL